MYIGLVLFFSSSVQNLTTQDCDGPSTCMDSPVIYGRGMVTVVTIRNYPAARDELVTASKLPANGNESYQWIPNGG